jgi:uncharacterized damage-inducible protein DinB
VTIYLIEQLPVELWAAPIPGSPRRTVGTIAGHLHNARCRWIRTLGGELGAGGTIPASALYTWRNLPLDVAHVLSYFVAHEAHHRGQIVLVARALGMRLPPAVTNGLWQWTRLAAEAKAER